MLVVFGMAFAVFVSDASRVLPWLCLPVALATMVARVPVLDLFLRLRAVAWFAVAAIGFNLFTVSGRPLFGVAGTYATYEGLLEGSVLTARVALVFWISRLFVDTTPIPTIVDGVNTVLPARIQVLRPIGQILTITLTFLPLLVRNARQIKLAQIARGADAGRGLLRQIRFALSATLPMVALALATADHLAQAMDSRCYDATAARTALYSPHMGSTDWVVIVLTIATSFVAATVAG